MVVEMKSSSSGVHSARRAARCWKRSAGGSAANAAADADAERNRVGRDGSEEEDARWAAMLGGGESNAERRGEGAGVGGETTGM